MRQITLTIPQPCAESWDAMTLTAAGRHCASCRKTVVDFTEKTDAEVLAHFQQVHWSGTCGRFRVGQLDRPLEPAAATRTWVRAWDRWPALLLGIWLSRETAAPAAHAQTPTEQRQPQPPAYLQGPDDTQLRLRGLVVDSAGLGIPGATVLLVGTATGISTRADGTFELLLPARLWRGEQSVVSFSSVGYQSVRMPLPGKPSPGAEPVRIVLQLDTTVLSQPIVMVAGGAFYRKPWPWHPRAFWFWLSRPFRR